MSSVKIHGAEYSISKIFSDDFVFSIPAYQRPYAWGTKQAGELLEDLLEFLGEGSQPIENINPYFLGSVVLIKGDTADAQIIDGQQRLTTLTILLAALRESLSSEQAKDFNIFIYQEGNKIKRTPNIYRLSLRDKDKDFFKKYIQHEGGINKIKELNNADLIDSQKRIQENAILFLDSMQKISEERRLRLAQFIVIKCFLVVVSTPDLDSAYRIFSVLNDRGLNLTKADIFKADVIGQIPELDEQQRYSKKWEDIEEDLGRSEFEDLLSYTTTIYKKNRKVKNILEGLRQQIKEQDVCKFIDETLIPFSESLYTIKNYTYQNNNKEVEQEINNYFKWLSRIDNSDWLPSAILYLSRYPNKPDLLLRFFSDLERLAAGLMIQQIPDKDRGIRYGQLLSYIEEEKDIYDVNCPLQLKQKEQKEILDILDGNIYQQNKKACKYVLQRLDSALAEGIASYDLSNITVEHILPQNPAAKTNWLSWFPNQKQRDKYVHRLGNLVLLSRKKNNQAGNFDFQDKKEQYFTKTGVSTFAITVQVLKENVWTPQIIEKRQKDLVNTLKIIWRLE